ncbi:phenylalanine--tRNA ligase subunit beta [Cyanobium sp. WAJ14-Wanaka]|uniref:phenylalanine--tRNA ligase subunit beta n=1 Tax=Cyanobium sp. WAJ14-Wanaka TaxID=2823725 RepID=UPI0020CC7625|nr:phenylalanine--tRNA ligase subunit beta [Cyanobium sp. WAJ14-Wanaka]MCP9774552.1 phenylalanine--tRNA ligase subunit beta [Cyanobium sp. WAJ14-Wanaka]
MRVSLQWLRELVSGPEEAFAPAALAERLSMAGFEVESISDLAAQAEGVVLGFVTGREPHPNADKLSVCQVDVGAEELLQIVCGATNVRLGIHVAVALVGATLPAVDLKIKPAELRGVASSGMICSLTELGLGASDGIAILDQICEQLPPLGSAVGPLLGLDDQVLELAITANRPDGLSMAGIAREVAALIGGKTEIPQSKNELVSQPLGCSSADLSAIETGGLFSITALGAITVAPSPAWIQQRLEKAGIRPINNVVDVTNLVMLETGQPLHAFDRASLASISGDTAEPGSLGLRRAQANEPFTSLDGEDRALEEQALVVTYGNRPIALAGVMGGLAEAVTETTTSIWLEAAMFDPQQVRQSARSVGLRTEASSRFEKGLPLETTIAAADRAVELMQEICGAKPEGRWLHRRPMADPEPLILRRDALHNLLGPVVVDGESLDLPDARVEQTLSALGCSLQNDGDDGWLVAVPPSRSMDLVREVDLIEEVARLVGYDQFACHLPDPIEPGGLNSLQQAERRLRRALTAAGLQEACSFSLVPPAEGRIPLANPLLADYGCLRDSIHPELLAAARRNLQSGQVSFWAFEIGQVFHADDKRGQRTLLVGLMAGSRRSECWSTNGKIAQKTYSQARGVLGQALTTLAIPCEDKPLASNELLHPGRAAELMVEGRPAGWFGQLHPHQAEEGDLPDDTYLFELDLSTLLTAATRKNRWQPGFQSFATVPASERDLAVVLPKTSLSSELISVIRKAGKPLLENVELIDRYEGAQVGDGLCSQAFRLRYRNPERTLTEEEVENTQAAVLKALEKHGAQLRC